MMVYFFQTFTFGSVPWCRPVTPRIRARVDMESSRMIVTIVVGLPVVVFLMFLTVLLIQETGDHAGVFVGGLTWFVLCIFFAYSVGLIVRPWLVWWLS